MPVLTLGFTGMDASTETELRRAFEQAVVTAGGGWQLVADTHADYVVVDMDSMYGPMSWLRLHAAGKQVIGLTAAPRTQTPFRIARPVTAEDLSRLLGEVRGENSASNPVAPSSQQAATASPPSAPTTGATPSGMTPSPMPQDNLPEERPVAASMHGGPANPAALIEPAQPVQQPPSAAAGRVMPAAPSIQPQSGPRPAAATPSPQPTPVVTPPAKSSTSDASSAPTSVFAPAPTAAAPAPTAPAPVRASAPTAAPAPATPAPARSAEPETAAEWLASGRLRGRQRIEYSGTALLFDADQRQYFGPSALKPLAPLFGRKVAQADFESVGADVWSAQTAALGAPQPLARLVWYGALLASQGRLVGGFNDAERFRLSKWPQTEREFPKHFRIATAMMRGPATLAEIAEASNVPLTDVTDFVNASLATGFAEPFREPEPEPEASKSGGLFGRLRGR